MVDGELSDAFLVLTASSEAFCPLPVSLALSAV